MSRRRKKSSASLTLPHFGSFLPSAYFSHLSFSISAPTPDTFITSHFLVLLSYSRLYTCVPKNIQYLFSYIYILKSPRLSFKFTILRMTRSIQPRQRNQCLNCSFHKRQNDQSPQPLCTSRVLQLESSTRVFSFDQYSKETLPSCYQSCAFPELCLGERLSHDPFIRDN